MHRRATSAIALALLWLLSACRAANGTATEAVPAPTRTPVSPTPTSAAEPAAVLTRVQGEVRLQQVISGQVVVASFGQYLWPGDVIVTGQDARAEAVCSDGVPIRVDAGGRLTVNCGETPDPAYKRVLLRVHGQQIEALPSVRDGPTASLNRPIILSPRNTWLLDGRPAIRWQAAKGAQEYEVVLSGLEGERWRATTQETALAYPDAQAALKPGASYTVQVIAHMRPAEPSQASETVLITVLPAEEAEQVRQFQAEIEALGLSAQSARFLLATYYADLELYDAALTEGGSLVQETSSALAHRLLGDLYLAVELAGEAAQHYGEARRLAQAENDPLVQAEAEVGLGHVAYATRRYQEALEHYQAALALYQELELEENAETAAKWVAEAKARLPTPAQ